jgi:hypothetical protein
MRSSKNFTTGACGPAAPCCYDDTREMLEGSTTESPFYLLLKFVATWITTWSGVPAGIFAPSLVLSLMASALVASGVSRLISAPLYSSLAQLQLQRLPKDEAQKKSPEGL